MPEPQINFSVKKAPMPEPELDIPQKKTPPPEPQINVAPKITKQELFVAKVLYSETSSIATLQEKIAICCVIQNRVHNKAFGNLPNAYEVCKQKNAFSCVGSTQNKNWIQFTPTLNKWTKLCCKMAMIVMRNQHKISNYDWTKDIVYYHDKSISKPKGWDNKYWRAILVKETQHFKFYKIVKAQSQANKAKKIKSKRK